MSISAQDLKKQLQTYYKKLDLVIEQVCTQLQKNVAIIVQRCREDLARLVEKQNVAIDELRRNDDTEINTLNQEFQDTKKALESCVSNPKFLNRLKEILAVLYSEPDHVRVIDDLGLKKSRIKLSESSINVWHSILDEAKKNNKVISIIQLAMREYPDNEELLELDDQWGYGLLISRYVDRKYVLDLTVKRQKKSDYLEIANKNCNFDEQKAILENDCRNIIETIERNLLNIQAIKAYWQFRLKALGEEWVTSEEIVISSSFDQNQSFGKIKQILQDTIASEIRELHSSLFLTYTLYRIFLKGQGHDLLEMLESPAITLDLLGGTLHSRLLYDTELDDLRLELEELLQPPYLTAWHKLPEDSAVSCAVIACAISPEGNWVLTGHNDKTLKLWDVATGTMEGEPLLHKAEIYDCELSYNGVRAITASADGLRIWHLISGTEYDTPGSFATTITKCCAFNQDSTQLIWSESQKLKGWIKVPASSVVATSDYDTVRLGQFYNQIIQRCAWDPHDRQVMAIAGSEIKIWDIEDDSVDYTFSNDGMYISCCAWRPDGTTIVFGALDHTLKIWEMTTNKVQHILVGHTAAVRGCGWSKSGEWIVSVSDDQTLKVWDATTGNCLSTFYADGPLTCCAIRADAQLVIAGGHKGLYWLKFNYSFRKDIEHV